jgi:hypothetical protein
MLTDGDLDNLRDLAKRQSANHAERKILAAVAEIERLRGLLRRCPRQIRGNTGEWGAFIQKLPEGNEEAREYATAALAEGLALLKEIEEMLDNE